MTGVQTCALPIFSINSNTGKIRTTSTTAPGVYTLCIANTGYDGSQSFITLNLTVTLSVSQLLQKYAANAPRAYTDNAMVYYKLHSLSYGGIGTVKNFRIKSRKT